MAVEVLERPLPKPSDEGYVVARLLEALAEARLALRFLEEGLTRNAAGRAFQAWRALLAALQRLVMERLKALARTEEERRWLESKAVPRVPTGKMVALSLMLERAGHGGVIAWTAVALDLHDYQYNGPDPDMALSKYTSRKSATADVVELLQALAKRVEALRGRFKGVEELDRALGELRKALALWVTWITSATSRWTTCSTTRPLYSSPWPCWETRNSAEYA